MGFLLMHTGILSTWLILICCFSVSAGVEPNPVFGNVKAMPPAKERMDMRKHITGEERVALDRNQMQSLLSEIGRKPIKPILSPKADVQGNINREAAVNREIEGRRKKNEEEMLLRQQNDKRDPNFDQVILFDNPQQFGFADTPMNEFHIWRAPYPTFGTVWPRPMQIHSQKRVLELVKTQFTIRVVKETNYILDDAIRRTRDLIMEQGGVSYYPRHWIHQEHLIASRKVPASSDSESSQTEGLVGQVVSVEVSVLNAGRAWPHLYMNESYTLDATSSRITIVAGETWGALHGLETLSQLVWQTRNGRFFINMTTIRDKPRYRHRGLLIDTARHYITKDVLLKNLDAMSYQKMNVMHWHLVDDQSFPFQSRNFPNLSDKGAFDKQFMIYTYDDIKEVVEYARIRGIRVIPEIDTPGHTYSWGKGMPELLTKCFVGNDWSGYLGPLNPARNATFDMLKKLFDEITELFQDDYIHLGADEVGTSCWNSNPEVQNLIKTLDIDRDGLLIDYYFRRLQNVITSLGLRDPKKRRGFHVWQEAFDNNVQLKSGSIVQIWKGEYNDVMNAAKAGHRVLYSTCWYLDRLEYGPQWIKFYQCDPAPDEMGPVDNDVMQRILGGEACMWSEYQTSNTILERIWPLASAVAERLWSPVEVRNLDDAGDRLEEMRCRLFIRGIEVGVASGPGMCEFRNNTSAPSGGKVFYRPRDIRYVRDNGDAFGGEWESQLHTSNSPSDTLRWVIFLLALLVILSMIYSPATFRKLQSHLRGLLAFNRRKIVVSLVVCLTIYVVFYLFWSLNFVISSKTVKEDLTN